MRRIVSVVAIAILVVYCTSQIAVGGPLSGTYAAVVAGVGVIIDNYQVISELLRTLRNRRPRESWVFLSQKERT